MQLEEVLEQPRLKILDTGALLPQDIFDFLDEYEDLGSIDEAKMQRRAEGVVDKYELLSNHAFFTIREVAIEVGRLNYRLNKILAEGAVYARTKRVKKDKSQEDKIRRLLDLITNIREYNRLFYQLASNKIVELSARASQEYKKLSGKIIDLCKLYPIKGISPRLNNKHELYTDEKIIALSLTLAEKNLVSIVTVDHHLLEILGHIREKGFDVFDVCYRNRASEIKTHYSRNAEDYFLCT